MGKSQSHCSKVDVVPVSSYFRLEILHFEDFISLKFRFEGFFTLVVVVCVNRLLAALLVAYITLNLVFEAREKIDWLID